MSLKIGIVGLPNVGKSTLFNALRSAQGKLSDGAKTANYPFTTIEPNVGVVEVPDPRLAILADVIKSSEGLSPSFKIICATVEFVDIAGVVKGAHKGEGLGNQFLSHIREVDAIVFVVRDFKNEDIISTGENPEEDLEVLKSELLLKDLEVVDKLLGTRDPSIKLGANKGQGKEKEVAEKAKGLIEQGKWIADEMLDEELENIGDLQLLSAKKYLVVVNTDEKNLKEVSKVSGAEIRICAKMEEELAGLEADEQKEYLESVGVKRPGLEILSEAAYKLLGLETFLTAGPKEVRAWTIKKGSPAPQAAGVIHTDFEKGFIAADVVPFEKFVEAGGWRGAREKGWVKTIGKAEVMPEDSVVEFKFSV